MPALTNFTKIQSRLDDHTVEQIVLLYPEEVREHVVWLAGFMRGKCNRQIAVLQQKCTECGFPGTDYGYWHKIITGKYFQPDSKGKVQGSVENLIQMLEALRELDRYQSDAGKMPFIETSTWHQIDNFITLKRQPHRVNKFGGIVGPTGTQKSASFKEYCVRNNHGKVKHFEAPEKPRMGQFIDSMHKAYYGTEYGNRSSQKKRMGIIEAVNETKCIIVDNVQRLYDPEAEGDQEVFGFMQKLQDDTGCTIIMSYTRDFERDVLLGGSKKGYFEQFIGRMGGIRRTKVRTVSADGVEQTIEKVTCNGVLYLADYPPREDVLMFANAFGLKEAGKHAAYLDRIVREAGRVRTLFEDLQNAKSEAGQNQLTIGHIRSVRGEEEV